MNKNNLENLEIKLKNAREENFEAFEKSEKLYKETYKDFLDWFFKSDILWVKKIISAVFQLESINWKKTQESFNIALEKGLNILNISKEKKELLKAKILKLENKKEKILDIFVKNSEIIKDKNYPILESLASRNILNNSELLSISSEFKSKWFIKYSLYWISKEKRELINHYIYLSNWINKEEKINSFKQEYFSEIKVLEQKYPQNIVDWVVKYVGRNFFKMKPYKKNLESRKLRLRRTFKIALLKLLRIKYKWFNVEELIKKINSMQDFESMFQLIMKLIDIIPENDELLEKYSLWEEIDEVDEYISEAEKNKEKILSGEESTIKICDLLDDVDKKLDKKVLEKILDEETDIVWKEIKIRTSHSTSIKSRDEEIKWKIINWHFYADQIEEKEEDDDDEEEYEELRQQDLELLYNEIKLEFSILDKQKLDYLINGDYTNLDLIVDKLTKIQIKLEKLEKLLI